jgi:UTP--glucose-1-phosphate uridylyltransferase
MTAQVRKAVFPVAGLGTRMLPATKAMPKEMLPVVDKPLIQYAVEEAAASGIEQFIFVTGPGKAVLEDHFDQAATLVRALEARGRRADAEALNAWLPAPGQVVMTRQHEPLGLGHAVWCARHLIGDEPFAVLLVDDVIQGERPCLGQLIDVHARFGGNVIAAMEVAQEATRRYGVIEPGARDGGIVEVKGLVEKPEPEKAPSRLAVIGRYVLEPRVLELLGRMQKGAGGEIQLTDALADLIGGAPFHGVAFAGQRFDCGDRMGYLQAIVAHALARDDLGPGFAAWLRGMLVQHRL